RPQGVGGGHSCGVNKSGSTWTPLLRLVGCGSPGSGTMTPTKQPIDFLIYLILFGSTIFVNKSVPVFLCLQNTLGAMLYLMEIAPSFRSGSGPLPLLASLVTIGTAVAAVLADIDMTFSDSAYFWMLVYLACVAVQTLHSKIADARYTDIDRLYFSYVFRLEDISFLQ
ncbi:hypothetical protein OTU49_001151, partial [Cherax quadricarinatus]